MCHSPAFTCWLYLAEDQPPIHRGAAIARSLGIPVDGEPELSAKIDTEEKGKQDEREHSTSNR